MANLIKTTVTIPEDLLQMAKHTAITEKTSLSHIFREGLETRVRGVAFPKKTRKKNDPLRFLGRFNLGIKVPYKHRSDLYDEHIKRKMGIRQ